MKTKLFKSVIFLLFLAAISINPVGWAAPTVYAASDSGINAPSLPLFAKEGDGGSSGLSPDSKDKEATDDKMREEKEHEHEGMHGMMTGHHSTGWAIAIGVVMVVMMAAMVL